MKQRETKGREMKQRERTSPFSPSLPIKPSSLLILRTFAFFAIFLRNLQIQSISRDFQCSPTFCNAANSPDFEGFADVSDHFR